MLKGNYSVILRFFASSNYSIAIVNLQNECAKVKIELQEQKKSVQRLTLELEKTKVHVRVTEDTRQKVVNASSEIPTIEYAGAEVFFFCVCVILFMK